ncbi:hypothetical protein D3C77_413610 [compost metagenome]
MIGTGNPSYRKVEHTMNKWKWTWLSILVVVFMTPLILSNTKASDSMQIPVVEQSSEYKQTVYINQLTSNASDYEVTVEPIEWYQGEEARKQFQAHEPNADIDGPLNDYYIINNNKPLETYTISPDAAVLMQIYDRTGNIEDIDIQPNESMTIAKFNKIFTENERLDLRQFPYHITIKDGTVVGIAQQYVP